MRTVIGVNPQVNLLIHYSQPDLQKKLLLMSWLVATISVTRDREELWAPSPFYNEAHSVGDVLAGTGCHSIEMSVHFSHGNQPVQLCGWIMWSSSEMTLSSTRLLVWFPRCCSWMRGSHLSHSGHVWQCLCGFKWRSGWSSARHKLCPVVEDKSEQIRGITGTCVLNRTCQLSMCIRWEA